MFSISQDFSDKDLEDLINTDVEIFFDEIVEAMRVVGRDFTQRARSKAEAGVEKVYNNITWNLVSSIGYCLIQQGEIVESYFPPLKAGADGHVVGAEQAERMAKETDQDDIALILVAGEYYSVFLEAKNYDVATNSHNISEAELDKLFA